MQETQLVLAMTSDWPPGVLCFDSARYPAERSNQHLGWAARALLYIHLACTDDRQALSDAVDRSLEDWYAAWDDRYRPGGITV
ncbi:MAG: hypothetical protein AAF125_07265 [Chloroflexota bacterium]